MQKRTINTFNMFLSEDELASLTHKRRKDAQQKELRFMGIDFRLRSDGSIAVLREHIVKEFGGNEEIKLKQNIRVEPNWDAINA